MIRWRIVFGLCVLAYGAVFVVAGVDEGTAFSIAGGIMITAGAFIAAFER